MIRLIHVRELDGAPNEDRQKIGRKRDVLLRNLGGRFGGTGLRPKIALEINHGRRRIRGGDCDIGARRVALVQTAVGRRLWQCDGALNNYLGPNGPSSETDSQNEEGEAVAHRSSQDSEKGASMPPIQALICPAAYGVIASRTSLSPAGLLVANKRRLLPRRSILGFQDPPLGTIVHNIRILP